MTNLVYVQSQIVCALIEMESMKAENQSREYHGALPCYGERDFLNLLDKYAIGHNQVTELLRRQK